MTNFLYLTHDRMSFLMYHILFHQVERELHKHEVLKEKERKSQEDQKREQDKELERERQRQTRERIDAERTSARRNKYSREALRAAAAAESKKEIVSNLENPSCRKSCYRKSCRNCCQSKQKSPAK